MYIHVPVCALVQVSVPVCIDYAYSWLLFAVLERALQDDLSLQFLRRGQSVSTKLLTEVLFGKNIAHHCLEYLGHLGLLGRGAMVLNGYDEREVGGCEGILLCVCVCVCVRACV